MDDLLDWTDGTSVSPQDVFNWAMANWVGDQGMGYEEASSGRRISSGVFQDDPLDLSVNESDKFRPGDIVRVIKEKRTPWIPDWEGTILGKSTVKKDYNYYFVKFDGFDPVGLRPKEPSADWLATEGSIKLRDVDLELVSRGGGDTGAGF
jgi:hypothetical protein